MTNAISITLAKGDLGGAPWSLIAAGEAESNDDAIAAIDTLNTAMARFEKIRVESSGAVPIFVELATRLDVPQALLKISETRFKTKAEIDAELGRLAANIQERFLALRAEALRRLARAEAKIDRDFSFLGVAKPFGRGSALVGAEVRLHLAPLIDDDVDAAFGAAAFVEIGAVGQVKLTSGGATVDAQIALACVIDVPAVGAAAAPRLRVDLHDLQFALPEITLPSWAFANGALWELPTVPDALNNSGRFLKRFFNGVVVTTMPHDEPRLAVKVSGGDVEWAVVKKPAPGAAVDWGNLQLATIDATISVAGVTSATIKGVTLKQTGGAVALTGDVTATANPVPIEGKRDVGVFEIAWRGAANLALDRDASGGKTLRARILFESLVVRLRDDPDAALVFRGEIELTPTGRRIVDLALVRPTLLQLLAGAETGIKRCAAGVIPVVMDFAKATQDEIKTLLDVLARMAQKFGAQFSQGLATVAEAVVAALRRLQDMVPSGTEKNFPFAVELRVSTDPLALRQALFTLRGMIDQSGEPLSALGFDISYKGWRPGLFLDFSETPGAYLTMTHVEGGTNAVVVSTDLWLKRKEGNENKTAAMRDADGDKKGERSKKPLIAVSLAPKAAEMIVVAGLRHGRSTFLQMFDGPTKKIDLPFGAGEKLRVVDGPYRLRDIEQNDIAIDLKFNEKRVLPLLGMGEAGEGTSASGGTFLDKLQNSLGSVVWVERGESKGLNGREFQYDLTLGVKAAGVKSSVTVKTLLSRDTFEARFEVDDNIKLKSRRIEERALGLVWVIEQKEKTEREANTEIDMFRLGFAGGQSGLELNGDKARMQLRFDGLSSDGKGVAFDVKTFKVGPGGLDLVAEVADEPVRLNGIDVAFRFTSGRIEIKGGKLVHAAAAGRGALPPALIGDASCAIALDFAEQPGVGIVLQSGTAKIEKSGEPIVCHGTRFTLTITDLDIGIVKQDGYHFFFLVTGSLRFTPKAGEFENGLLKFLDGVELTLERTPLAADARVLAKHISFQKQLNPKKSFNLFNLFTFEMRGFGYHPSAPKFGGDAALNISGQIKFVEIGDVMQPSIDFHGLWMALPAPGQSLPRIKADGLGVDLNLKGAIRVKGSVLALDRDTRTVEGADYAPKGYDMSGFLGAGELKVPGLGDFSANLGFVELEKQDAPGERKKAFYFYADKKQTAVEIETPIWVFYLREYGFGFGFRYTLEALKAADNARSVPKLIAALDDVSKRQGDLHKFSAWRPDPEGDHVTLALKGALQVYPAQKVYDAKKEEPAENPLFFDLVAALRSDFTLFVGARGWLGTNYFDYETNEDDLRIKPGLRGYLYISASQQRLLMRAIGDSGGYIGQRIKALAVQEDKTEPPLRRALRSVDWSATLFVKPGLFHYELGWPNQLSVRLIDKSNMRVTVRGGMIFRAAEDGLLWGYNIEADAFFQFGGSLQTGPLGVVAEARLDARFVARIIAYLSWRFSDSLAYGLMSLDAVLVVRFSAWLDVDLGFTSFTIRIGFSLSLQITVAIEAVITPKQFGARVDARVAVNVFGATLSVQIGFAINADQLANARAQVQRFLAMSITAEEPDAAPAFAVPAGDKTLQSDAGQAAQKEAAPPIKDTQTETTQTGSGRKFVNRTRAWLGHDIQKTDFWLVLRKAETAPGGGSPSGEDFVYAMLVPKEPPNDNVSGFFASPPSAATKDSWPDDPEAHKIVFPAGEALENVSRFDPVTEKKFVRFDPTKAIPSRWNGYASTDKDHPFKLGHLIDECFLYDAEWKEASTNNAWRKTVKWREPPARRHLPPEDIKGETEEARAEQRDRAQRDRNASAVANPIIESVHQARSTTLTMFIDQFLVLARTGDRPRGAEELAAHVTDLGLVFYGPAEEVEKIAKATIVKRDSSGEGKIDVLNPRAHWFDRLDPVLKPPVDAKRRHGAGIVTPAGVKLAWKLALFGRSDQKRLDPDHFLEHYIVTRTIGGLPGTEMTREAKPVSTFDAPKEGGDVPLHASDWTFVDDLADLPPQLRKALLPASDETQALAAAIAWVDMFGDDRRSIDIYYSVTPRDIAGAYGAAKGFVVEAPQPQVPVRAAEAELRFVARKLNLGADGAPPKDDDALGVVMTMRDQSFLKGGTGDEFVIGDRSYRIKRSYRLIAEREDILPSGHYGSDGLTDRHLAPPSSFVDNADNLVWTLTGGDFVNEVDKNGKVKDTSPVRALESDEDTIKKFPYWRALAGKTGLDIEGNESRLDTLLAGTLKAPPEFAGSKNFRERLWTREGDKKSARIATRFWLVTVQKLVRVDDKTDKAVVESCSKPTPVAIELRVQNKLEEKAPPGVSRPEAFEWPAHFVPPPLAEGQVRAATGFARFKAPSSTATLKALLGQTNDSLVNLRDPQRRVITQISFDAAPKAWSDIAGIHQAAIAGFDLHELDIDDLARLDTSKDEFAKNTKTWRRARRVARIERVSPHNARLSPGDAKDWQGWQAHYPSETWRIAHREIGREQEAKPKRAPWRSPSESTIAFSERNPRLRFFPTAPENAIQELMRAGLPTKLIVELIATTEGSGKLLDQAKNEIDLTLADIDATAVSGLEKNFSSLALAVFRSGNAPFDAPHLREALLRLMWRPKEKCDTIPSAFRDDPTALDGISIRIKPIVTVKRLSRDGDKAKGEDYAFDGPIFVAPLSFNAFIHPLLEEVLGELEYHGAKDRLYRRYAVTSQATALTEAATVDEFLSATDAEKDPYGWGALQLLGLATTARLYDRDLDEFLNAKALGDKVDAVMSKAIERYKDAYRMGDDNRSRIGAPFVEVLLQPMRDRAPGAFDAILKSSCEPADRAIDLRDDGLAFMQLSLRPVPVTGMAYHDVSVAFEQTTGGNRAEWPDSFIASKSTGELAVIDGYELRFKNESDFAVEILRPQDRALIRLAKKDDVARLPLIAAPRPGRSLKEPPPIRLQLRAQRDKTPNIGVELVARVVEKTMTGQNPGDKVFYKTMSELFAYWNGLRGQGWAAADWNIATFPTQGVSQSDPQLIANPGKGLQSPAGSPFERFPALDPDQWTALGAETVKVDSTEKKGPVNAAIDCLVQNLRRAAPKIDWAKPSGPSFDDLKKVMGKYLVWSQRFLDHCAAPDGGAGASPPIALAAPIKAQPWRLGADSRGRLSLSFLHEDRWAHSRAYAVRPTGRYEHLAIGAGLLDPAESETLVSPRAKDPLDYAIGYALAVSPRTERIEPPVFLGSSLVEKGDDKGKWQIVLARHGEESLAFSNRPLFARLGTDGTAIAFLREYRDRNWLERFKAVVSSAPDLSIYPKKEPKATKVPEDASAIAGDEFASVAKAFPDIWRGADVLRVGDLLPHYRYKASATARAGVVVSNVVVATQDETPRKALKLYDTDKPKLLGTPKISIVRVGRQSVVKLSGLRMATHADIAEQPAFDAWLKDAGKDDVAWWPDPEVAYMLLLRGGTKNAPVDDETAVVAAVPTQTSGRQGTAPLALRCRNQRFDKHGEPAVAASDQPGAAPPRPRFELSFELSRKQTAPLRARADNADKDKRDKLRAATAGFAEILEELGFVVTADANRDAADIDKQANAAAALLEKIVRDATGGDNAEARAAKNAYQEIAKKAAVPGADLDPLLNDLRRARQGAVFSAIDLQSSHADGKATVTLTTSNVDYLTLNDLPPDDKIADIKASGHQLADAKNGALWRLARDMLMGGDNRKFWLRAVDARNAIAAPPSPGGGWSAPGEIEIQVEPPEWAKV